MKTRKAYIRLDGEVDLKEMPAIEFVDQDYADKLEERRKGLNALLSNHETKKPSASNDDNSAISK